MKQKKWNGSADLLANAIRQVFEEATEKSRVEVREAMHEVREAMHEMERNLSHKMDTTNEKMQAQFACQEEQIAGMVAGGNQATMSLPSG